MGIKIKPINVLGSFQTKTDGIFLMGFVEEGQITQYMEVSTKNLISVLAYRGAMWKLRDTIERGR